MYVSVCMDVLVCLCMYVFKHFLCVHWSVIATVHSATHASVCKEASCHVTLSLFLFLFSPCFYLYFLTSQERGNSGIVWSSESHRDSALLSELKYKIACLFICLFLCNLDDALQWDNLV